MGIRQAFEDFMEKDFHSAVESSTIASWGGSGYSVEFFDNGAYRLLWDNQIGNLYDSPGLILSVPSLGDDDWDDDPDIRFYGNAQEEFRCSFQEHWEANLNVQAVIASQ